MAGIQVWLKPQGFGAGLGHLRNVDFSPNRSWESVERGKDTKVVVRPLHAHWFGELFEGLH